MADQKSDDKREKYREALQNEYDRLGGDFGGVSLGMTYKKKLRWQWCRAEITRLRCEGDDKRWKALSDLARSQSCAKEPPE